MSSFLHQFEVHTIFSLHPFSGFSLDFTNSSLCMVIATALIMLVLSLSTRTQALIPSGMQSFGEVIFDFISNTLSKAAGPLGSSFLPFMLMLFTFIMSCNMLGLVPGAFTVTSQIGVTFCMSTAVLLILTAFGFSKQGAGFLSVFLPHGVPLWLAPLIVLIEVIAYLFRTVSLSLRLTANMVAGHVMIKVIAALGSSIPSVVLLAAPTVFLTIVIAFEFFVAILQAYIFVVLSCVYLSDSFKKH